MLSKWPIRNKLLFGLALLLVIEAALSWSGIHGLNAYRSLVRSLSRRVPELPLAGELRGAVSDLEVVLIEARSRSGIKAPGSTAEPFGREQFRVRLDVIEEKLRRYRERLADNPDHSGRISDAHREWAAVRQIEASLVDISAASSDQDWMLDQVRFGDLSDKVERLQRLAADLPNYLHENIRQFTDDARSQYRTLLVLTWGTSITAMAMFALFVKLSYGWIFRPLRTLIKGSRKIASGQFHYRIRLDTEDEMAELAAAMNDMTSRFQAIRDDLDRQVRERTKQVVRSEQLASVGFLAAGVAHEINNPLASIALCAESLESRLHELLEGDDDRYTVVRNYLRMIQDEAFRCKGITEQLLDFSRLGEAKRQRTELSELVRAVIDMLGHLGKYRDKAIDFESADLVHVTANPQEMKQVVLNLLTNALDAMDSGGRVSVRITPRDGQAELSVSDNGCGMTPEVLEHLFEPFFTRRRGGQGTGLGLSIAYRIITDHQGSIEATSGGPGRGSHLVVRLPLHAEHKEIRYRYQAA